MSRFALLVLALVLATAGCQRPAAVGPTKSPDQHTNEGENALLTLSAADAESAGIETLAATNRPAQDHLALTGWIMAKPGNEVTLTAPGAGFVRTLDLVPSAGQMVKQGQLLLALEPVLSPLETIEYAVLKRNLENELAKAAATVEQARLAWVRAEDDFRQGLTQPQHLDKAKLGMRHAAADLTAVQDKLKFSTVATTILTAPQAGTVLAVHVNAGQFVTAAAPLVTIINLNPPWVRVPVPAHPLLDVDREQSAHILSRPVIGKHTAGTNPMIVGNPVAFVPQIDPARHTADLMYELQARWLCGTLLPQPLGPAGDVTFGKGQKVTVQVPLGRSKVESIVPYSSIIFDSSGDTWLYLDKAGADSQIRQYQRHRVELVYEVDGDVVIRPAIAEGERVVTRGAAHLYNREFRKMPRYR